MERKKIIEFLKKVTIQNGIKKAFLFGSFARGEKYHDIDIAIEPPEGFTLLDLSRIANEIKDKLGVEVDLITTRSIHPLLKESIQRDLVLI
ncbi:MAG: nucleotidyltransferase domain-containing protein [Candidatus Micrarchaeota archaeon]|nr:nucleotidyltransferase domain-containing protein [Candidatus Micrarchaeota archaeon]